MRLLVDLMCGGVVSYLRMCGHDTVYTGDRALEADDAIRDVAREEGRTIVTRDVDLATRAERSILLESRPVEGQLAELAAAGIDLELESEPTYCGACNGDLERVESGSTPEYAPDLAETAVWRCRDCGQHFWKGSHWDRVRETLERVHSSAGTGETDVRES
ncbi:Mut7-C RNAse domain-containing protein [Natrialbaceae archaeon AArc-T1-2]|uniref:Mut7-C RNAse domain-containing protein n=1 Tax=Natrialbaceae archaeon AArc-T1-2 TaxID=3053904 RepID=UPI00255B1547|nr:Mut7-C RNAse domain-containing protein [Natrialbaceae archaeon AArc-T1-2]WIV66899.1 Mut7-C RNAse domain-containing protein [Natrialbaceae archaeon AArc-T1-2]